MTSPLFLRRLVLSVLLLLTGLRAGAHTYHASIMDVRYNAGKQQLEVALKVFTDDLEKALSTGQPAPVTIEQLSRDRLNALAEGYLRRTVRFGTKPGETLPLQLLGVQKESDAHWVYFTVKPPKPVKGIYLQHRLLLDSFEDQMNIVNLEAGGKKQSALFRAGEESQKLMW
ncbi:hypothetical protein LJY25_11075 [Hymenobacter sp. BT175]|uniref:DUF6702 family protein n=1 Tax=Hymenobacter translucens TaxID=2886507 RepID=UPI001D0F3448|nr:DUF6702 family protein [Hymenobacter translucens]MCC2546989.1 hypothetical protein [Hymenobacter translucens]